MIPRNKKSRFQTFKKERGITSSNIFHVRYFTLKILQFHINRFYPENEWVLSPRLHNQVFYAGKIIGVIYLTVLVIFNLLDLLTLGNPRLRGLVLRKAIPGRLDTFVKFVTLSLFWKN